MDHTRHQNIFNVGETTVTLIGVGGIGSATGIVLSKMGIRLMRLFDPQDVDEENIATQMYPVSDVGKTKVRAMEDLIQLFSDETYAEGFFFEYYNPQYPTDIVISAVDSITARKDIWEKLQLTQWKWYLDARMSAEVFQLHVVQNGNTGWYEYMLSMQDEDGIPDDPCTEKATIYTASFSAGFIGAAVKEIVTGNVPARKVVMDIRNMEFVKII